MATFLKYMMIVLFPFLLAATYAIFVLRLFLKQFHETGNNIMGLEFYQSPLFVFVVGVVISVTIVVFDLRGRKGRDR